MFAPRQELQLYEKTMKTSNSSRNMESRSSLKKKRKNGVCAGCGEMICCHNGLCMNCDIDKLRKNKKYRWGEEQK
jgi:hypothetical protein